jgi:acylphosphatase
MSEAENPSASERTECVRCLISGRVQGVYFRASARDQAQRLGVGGYARNLPDGRVEVLACGPPNALAVFKAWLHRGPAAAEVNVVECEPAPGEPADGFRTL